VYVNEGVGIPGEGAGSKVKAHTTSGGRKMPVRHTIPLGIVIFLVLILFASRLSYFMLRIELFYAPYLLGCVYKIRHISTRIYTNCLL